MGRLLTLLRPKGDRVLFFDSFTDADGTLLTNHTPDVDTVGGGWVDIGGPWDINGNRARSTAGSTWKASVIDTGRSDVLVTADLTVNSFNVGIVLNAVDASNYWTAQAMRNLAELRLQEQTGGTSTVRASTSRSYSGGETFTLTAKREGAQMTVTEGANELSYSSSLHAASTRHGIRAYAENSYADSFEVVG